MLYESATLAVESHYGIATLRFRRDAVWPDILSDFHAALDRLDHPAYDVLVVREFQHLPAGRCSDWRPVIDRIVRWPIPTVAFVAEPCGGPALDLVLACAWRTAVGWRPAFADRAWPSAVAELQLMALEQSLQQWPRRPNGLGRWLRGRRAAA